MPDKAYSFKLNFPVKESFRRDLLADRPELVYSFKRTTPEHYNAGIVAVWYGGESHIGHWYTQNGREIAMVTRYNDNAPEPNLYTAENWLAFFVEHTNDFYDNWAADDWR